jgi:endonuclease YncB( thermonuclease family)
MIQTLYLRKVVIKVSEVILLLVCFNVFGLVFQAGALTITGKMVGVSDGDTITVLQDPTQYKIRLYGIDCPEGIVNIFSHFQFWSQLSNYSTGKH